MTPETTATSKSAQELPNSCEEKFKIPFYRSATLPNSVGELESSSGTRKPNAFARYVPPAVWVAVIATLLLIPLKIISYGFLASGDARRHVAKAFTEKPYTEIIVMRPEYKMDHSPGWEFLLRKLQRTIGWGSDELMTFSVISMMLCVFLAPLPWLRRPEAWVAALLAQMVAIPDLMTRFVQARPYLLTEGILIAVLFGWAGEKEGSPSRLKLVLTTLGISLSVWIHGAWYFWALPLSAFLVARRWRDGIWLGCCIAAGTLVGALLTGRPIEFLQQALLIIGSVAKEHVPQWVLVGELRPSYGEFTTGVLIVTIILWRRQELLAVGRIPKFNNPTRFDGGNGSEIRSARNDSAVELVGGPVLWLVIIGWILGFKADRFWADWGIPAALVWLTLQLEEPLKKAWEVCSPRRLLACGFLAIPLFLHTTNDLDRRYTGCLSEAFLDGKEPALQGWLPGANGIFYNAQMEFFYNTFYKNPDAHWRYILGMEPALMPPDDLAILRHIQTQPSFQACEPWAQKMRPEDRLVIRASGEPNLSRLEWTNALGDFWFGRLRAASSH